MKVAMASAALIYLACVCALSSGQEAEISEIHMLADETGTPKVILHAGPDVHSHSTPLALSNRR